ncbi:MAG: redoxin family protein [Candidatus Eremiobacteraeota bacterium]|nr:redoxin family protein [Candidatus Eremiobacteraeota bacterium]
MSSLSASIVAALVAALALPAAAAADTPASPAAAATPALGVLPGPQVGAPAPAFSLKTLEGKSVSLDAYRGKTLVINAWATWCPPCREEMPDLIASAPKLANDGVVVLGVDTTESAPIVRAYVAAKGVTYAQAIDADRSFAKAYDVQYFPTTFVIDARGVLRARYVDVITAAQLFSLVADAKHGVDGRVVSALQTKIDATLSDPSIDFSGDPAAIEANAKKAANAIAAADNLLDESDAAKGNPTDFLRTRAEQSALRDKAVTALVSIGTSTGDQALLPRLRGDAARDREQWKDALDAYRAALALDPKNTSILSGIALAAGRLEQYDAAVDADRQIVALSPDDVDGMVTLARAQLKTGHTEDAYATFARAAALAKRHVDADPGKASLVRMLAYVHAYTGRAYAQNGDRVRARAEFEQLLSWAQKLPPSDARHDMYIEEGQEAIVALGLAAPHRAATVSLVPWTGPDLPGSIPNTRKFRLVVVGTSGKDVALSAGGVPKGWVASFCTDRVCSPSKVTLAVPTSGVKIVEFQLIPPGNDARTPKVRVTARDGASVSSATT